MTRLILLRHGESEANARGIFAGQRDYPLTDKGREQARQAAIYLTTHEQIDHIYSSDLSRAVETARFSARMMELSVHVDPRLREFDTGEWAGLTAEERQSRYPEEYRALREEPARFRYPGGESVPEVYDRVVEAITEIAERYPDRCVLIVTHNGAIRAFESFALGHARDEGGHTPQNKNASLHIYEWRNGKAHLHARDITDHLSEESAVETV